MNTQQTMLKAFLTLLLITIFFGALSAQHLPIATNFRHAYQSHTRSTSGAPGPAYWQNTGKYKINVNFNPSTRLLDGHTSIDYINNSPDTLKYLILKLYPNLYQSGSMRNSPIVPADISSGVTIKSLQFNNKAAKHRILGTNMYLQGIQLLPGQHAQLDIDYNYTLNQTSFMRTGQVDTGAFVIAYFFPRVTVYDDIDGWNDYPYLGKEEFYNDYCDFSVDITIPDKYAVWATGELTNANEVYHPNIIKRLSAVTDTVTDIIKPIDWQSQAVVKSNHWHFEAQHVTDFAFTASNHYSWKAASIIVDPATKRWVQANAVFNPAHTSFEPVATYVKNIVNIISHTAPGIPFPYPHATVFEGLDAMEYPMMVNNLPFEGLEAVQFTVHEVFHTLFPFYVASNETKYSFMDEGFATFSEFALLDQMQSGYTGDYDLSPVNNTAGSDIDMPIMTPTAQLYGKARFSNKDLKPALGLQYVKELLGDALFYKAVRHYINQWHGKHPTPYDMFACLNQGAGTNLDWFWQNWFFEKNIPDLGISKVTSKSISISRVGAAMVPVHLAIVYTDGTKEKITRKIDCWKNNEKTVTIHTKKAIASAILGDSLDTDVDPGNNRFGQ